MSDVRTYFGDGLGSFYYDLIRDLTNYGRKVIVRGNECIEFPAPVVLVYEKPGHCWMNIPKRRFNPFFAIAEVYWILTGMGNVDWIAYYNKRMRDFNDGGEDNHGAYGLRIRHWRSGGAPDIDQIQHVVRKLTEDPCSRQAIISLWDPVRDNLYKSKDIPCNNQISYSLRDGVLDQTVVIRSNDLVWGTPYNAVQFSHLHALVAGMLKVKIGTFTYFIENLHYYLNLYKPTLANLLEKSFLRYQDHPFNPGAEVISNFDTATGHDLFLLEDSVNFIYESWSSLMWTPLRQAHFSGSGYWGQTIPLVLWIHRILKEGIQIDSEDKVHLAERILTLGHPLNAMIVDFLEDSSNEIYADVANLCRQLFQPSNG
jgi:thymidylate synthase